MTFMVRMSMDYQKDRLYDLDDPDDYDLFNNLDFTNLAVHLYPNERIIIECLKREGLPEDKI